MAPAHRLNCARDPRCKSMESSLKSRVPLILMAVLVARCGSRTDPKDDAGTGQDAHAAPDVASDTASDAASDGSTATDAVRPATDAMAVMGGPGCGLAAAAFCDTFEAPSAQQGTGASSIRAIGAQVVSIHWVLVSSGIPTRRQARSPCPAPHFDLFNS